MNSLQNQYFGSAKRMNFRTLWNHPYIVIYVPCACCTTPLCRTDLMRARVYESYVHCTYQLVNWRIHFSILHNLITFHECLHQEFIIFRFMFETNIAKIRKMYGQISKHWHKKAFSNALNNVLNILLYRPGMRTNQHSSPKSCISAPQWNCSNWNWVKTTWRNKVLSIILGYE